MKAIIYSDLQATESSDRLRSNPSISLQNDRVTAFLTQLVDLMEAHKADYVWDLGDTLDDRSTIPVPTIQSVTDMMELVAPSRSLSIKLVGNHEQHYKNSLVHSGGLFRRWFSYVVDSPTTLNFHKVGLSVACLPFPAPGLDLESALSQIESECTEKKRILIGHLDVVGAVYPSGTQIEKGLSRHWLEKFDVCLFGHVHKHQKLSRNAWYVGSPFQQDFNEAEQAKYVAILDLETLEIKWVELTKFPKYRSITVDDLDGAHQSIGEDRVRVVLSSAHEAEIFYAHPIASIAHPVYAYKNETVDTPESVTIGDPKSYVERWAKTHPLDWIGEDELIAIGNDLLVL